MYVLTWRKRTWRFELPQTLRDELEIWTVNLSPSAASNVDLLNCRVSALLQRSICRGNDSLFQDMHYEFLSCDSWPNKYSNFAASTKPPRPSLCSQLPSMETAKKWKWSEVLLHLLDYWNFHLCASFSSLIALSHFHPPTHLLPPATIALQIVTSHIFPNPRGYYGLKIIRRLSCHTTLGPSVSLASSDLYILIKQADSLYFRQYQTDVKDYTIRFF